MHYAINLAILLAILRASFGFSCEDSFLNLPTSSLDDLSRELGMPKSTFTDKQIAEGLTPEELKVWSTKEVRREVLEDFVPVFVNQVANQYEGYVRTVIDGSLRFVQHRNQVSDIVQQLWLKLTIYFKRHPENLVKHYHVFKHSESYRKYISTIAHQVRADYEKPAMRSGRTQLVGDAADEVFGGMYYLPPEIADANKTPLPIEQFRLFERGDLTTELLDEIVKRERVSRKQVLERNQLLDRNIAKLTERFHSGDNRAERRDSQLRVVPIAEQKFYNIIAQLDAGSRLILGLYFIEGKTLDEIMPYFPTISRVSSVGSRLSAAMKRFKELSGMADDKKVRAETLVVMLREQAKLTAPRSSYYIESNVRTIALAKQYDGFDIMKDLGNHSYRDLMSLINPVQAEYLDLIIRSKNTPDEAASAMGMTAEEGAVVFDLGTAALAKVVGQDSIDRWTFIEAARRSVSIFGAIGLRADLY